MTGNTLNRRQLVQGAGAGVAATIAGCIGGNGDDSGDNDGGGNNGGGGNNNGGDSNAEVHVLTDYANKRWQKKWENEIIPGFEAKYPAPLKVEYTGFQGTGESRLTTLIQSGNPPELFTATIAQIGDLIAQGQTRPIGDFVSELEASNGEMLFKDTIRIGGNVLMVPHGLYLGGTLNYRKDIYEKLGLSVPKTWDELVANAKAIDEADDVNARGFAMPAQTLAKSGSDFVNWLYNAGGGSWKWKNEEESRVKLWYSEEHVTAALEHMKELANYSPDPSSLNWGPTIRYWAGGRIAQCIMNNAWLAGVAYAAGAKNIGLNTGVAPVPKRAGSDPLDRGWALLDGTPILSGADNPEGAKNLLRYMYGSPSKQADKNLVTPMRFLPPYKGIIESDTYQSGKIFQAENGHFLDLNRKCMEEIAPNLSSEKRPATVETLYVTRFPIQAQLVNAVVVRDVPVEQAYQTAKDKMLKRLEEARNL